MKTAIVCLVFTIFASSSTSAQLVITDPLILTLSDFGDAQNPNYLNYYGRVKEEDLHLVPRQYKDFANRTLTSIGVKLTPACNKEVL